MPTPHTGCIGDPRADCGGHYEQASRNGDDMFSGDSVGCIVYSFFVLRVARSEGLEELVLLLDPIRPDQPELLFLLV